MQFALISALILIAEAPAPVQFGEPAVPVHYGGLPLETPAGRAALRERVTAATRGFCSKHRRDVTPDVFRNDKFYCEERVRRAIVTDLPRPAREAYRQALREAGVRGRRL